MFVVVRRLLLLLLVLALGLGAAVGWWLTQPLGLSAERVEFQVPAGASWRVAARRAAQAGVQAPDWLIYAYFRQASQGRAVQVGDYEIERGTTAAQLLDKLVKGDRVLLGVTLVEGWTFAQVRQALGRAAHLRSETAGLSPQQIMDRLGRPDVPAEGRFFPDTYHYSKGSSDVQVLRQALELMEQQLQAAWQLRAPDLPLRSADEALILASIVEKETGRAADRAEIAGVFINRLRIGMRLQTDPTVIYGVGEGFEGRLRRVHLDTDTPFNTYTRAGLPPTPIAMPGRASLMAAVQPAATRSLYFVARGDGSSQFSANLADHNRAVNQYQRGGRKP